MSSGLVAGIVVAYAGRPFFEGAWRDLHTRAIGMDVPVALAIGVAFLASLVSTLGGGEAVYFESACMFTFFLGLSRHVEMSARHARDARARARFDALPEVALRLRGDRTERVSSADLQPGERVVLGAGTLVPVDGRVVEGSGASDESMLTGEALQQPKRLGDAVIGGSRWLSGRAVVRVERCASESTLARIRSILERAQCDRPKLLARADRIASAFVVAVLACAAATFAAWWRVEPAAAIPVALSVLVATCPCALALAAPAALSSASAALAQRGLLICRGNALEGLAAVTHVAFDKTGTLVRPAHWRVRPLPASPWSATEIEGLARALEREVDHPIASALRSEPATAVVSLAEKGFDAELTDRRVERGVGVEARLSGQSVRLGHPSWAVAGAADSGRKAVVGDASFVLAVGGVRVADFHVDAALRRGARRLVRGLACRGFGLSILSGDPSESAVLGVARSVGILDASAGQGPEQKVEAVLERQRTGERVAVVGDGVNDAPVLAQADLGIALGSGTDLARSSADVVLLGDRLDALEDAFDHARRTRRVILQNVTWAIAYNVSVLPAAMSGLLAPWMAALGMSASSLLVVGNSLRLRRLSPKVEPSPERPLPADAPAWTAS